MKSCPFCSNQNDDNAYQCFICGYSLKPQQNTQPQYQQYTQPQYQQNTQPQYQQYERSIHTYKEIKEKKKPIWLIIISVIALVVGICWVTGDFNKGAELADEWTGIDNTADADTGVRIISSDYDLGAIADITVEDFVDQYNENLSYALDFYYVQDFYNMSEESRQEYLDYLTIKLDDAVIVSDEETNSGKAFNQYLWNKGNLNGDIGISVATEPESGKVRDICIGIGLSSLKDDDLFTIERIRFAAAYSVLSGEIPDAEWMMNYATTEKSLFAQSLNYSLWYDNCMFSVHADTEAFIYMISPISDEVRDRMASESDRFKYFVPISEYDIDIGGVQPVDSIEIISGDSHLHFNYTFEEFLSTYNRYLRANYDVLDSLADEFGVKTEQIYALYGLYPCDFVKKPLTQEEMQSGITEGFKYVYHRMDNHSNYWRITIYVNDDGYVYKTDHASIAVDINETYAQIFQTYYTPFIAASTSKTSNAEIIELQQEFTASAQAVPINDEINRTGFEFMIPVSMSDAAVLPMVFSIKNEEYGYTTHHSADPNSDALTIDELIAKIKSETEYIFDMNLDGFEIRYCNAMKYYADQVEDIEIYDLRSYEIYAIDTYLDGRPICEYYYGEFNEELEHGEKVKIMVRRDSFDRVISVKVITYWRYDESVSQEKCWLDETEKIIRYGKMFENICALAFCESPTENDIEFLESLHDHKAHSNEIYDGISYSVEYDTYDTDSIYSDGYCTRIFTIRAAEGTLAE